MSDLRVEVMHKLKGLLETKTNKKVTQGILDCFLDAFEGFPPSRILHGIKQCAISESFGNVTPYDILRHLRPTVGQVEILAVDAIGALERAIVNENYDHIKHDPILCYIARLGGGLERLAEMSNESFVFYLKNQKSEYVNLSNSPEAMAAIELKDGQPLLIQDLMTKVNPKELKA